MRKWTIFTLLSLLCLHCIEENKIYTSACIEDVPMGEVAWISVVKESMANCSCETSLMRGSYEGAPVFYVVITLPVCDLAFQTILYDCEGDEVRRFDDTEREEFEEKVQPDSVVYLCSPDNSNACESGVPIDEVGWVSALKESMGDCPAQCENSLIKATYEGITVFYVAMTSPTCNGVFHVVLFDCEGNEVRTFTASEQDEFYAKVNFPSVLYRC